MKHKLNNQYKEELTKTRELCKNILDDFCSTFDSEPLVKHGEDVSSMDTISDSLADTQHTQPKE